MEIFDILGRIPTPARPIEVKFCTAKRTQVPIGHAKFDLNRSTSRPCGAKNQIFGLRVNLIKGKN